VALHRRHPRFQREPAPHHHPQRMRKKAFRLELGGLAATAMRCSMGVISDFL
jgi:hypothetical protein